jgi:hypothetical protein
VSVHGCRKESNRRRWTEIALLHYRYRFDPSGLVKEDRERLKETAKGWIARHGEALRKQ